MHCNNKNLVTKCVEIPSFDIKLLKLKSLISTVYNSNNKNNNY